MQVSVKAYIVSLLLHLLFFLMYPLVLTPLYKNSELLKSPKVVEIDLTLEYEKELERKEPPHLTGEKREKRQEVVHKQRTQAIQSTSQVHEAPMRSAQEQNQVIPTTNISQGKDQRGGTDSHTEGSQPSNKKAEAGSGGGDTSSTSNVQKELFLKEKLSVISSLVQKSITYPLLARKMGWEGRVVVCFRLTPDGRLEDLHVLESSGYEILDRSALEAVSRSAHLFPKPPVEVLIKLPVNFRLE
ncbi:TonB family protein [Hydrogenobacter hydrogenophilus]|uniref:Protein TonB n=1 Tax=Hydrogenobacter hydrogenophilus TaxID=35835 RepID=A0A285NXH4_9AQUI|nr:energy transducer TonB [Hydrogenobacter hydrogenophilus]SNZ13623.1 protein TonB [Hydrogenobacter hydrogenophilus]